MTWVGPMTFDVSSARLQYSRVLIGEEELAVNVGDTILFKIVNVHNSGRSMSNLSSSQPSSPSNSNSGIPENGNNNNNCNEQFAAARILQLWHNPRGKLERTASVQVYSHLVLPSLPDILFQQRELISVFQHQTNNNQSNTGSNEFSVSSRSWLLSDLFFLLSRCVLKLDEVPTQKSNHNHVKQNDESNNNNSNNSNLELSSSMQENNNNNNNSNSNTSLRSMINLEIPLWTVDRKAEIREFSECGACVACFLRSTSGILDSTSEMALQEDGLDNNNNTPSSVSRNNKAKNKNSSSSISLSQSSNGGNNTSNICTPPVLVTDQQLKDLVSSYNFKATRDLYSSTSQVGGNNNKINSGNNNINNNMNNDADVISSLAKLKRSIDERLSFILGKCMNVDRSCSNCEQQRQDHIRNNNNMNNSNSNSFSSSSNQAFLDEILDSLKKKIMNRLLIPVYSVPDIASSLRKQQQPQQIVVEEAKNDQNGEKSCENVDENGKVEKQIVSSDKNDRRRARSQDHGGGDDDDDGQTTSNLLMNEDEIVDVRSQEQEIETKQPCSQQPTLTQSQQQLISVFSFPSLAASGIKLEFLRVEDPSLFTS